MRAARDRAAAGPRQATPRRRPPRRGARPSNESRAVAADHAGLVGELVAREHEEAAPAQELIFPAGHDLRAALSGLVGLVVVLFALEGEEDYDEPDEPGEGGTKIVPRRENEFLCRSCFLVLPRHQLADETKMICRDCA